MTRFGPLIFRIAAWPIESLLGIASRRLAPSADAWLETEDRLRREAELLCAELFNYLPSISDRGMRGVVLALRRALHRSLDPTAADTLADVLHRADLPRQVRRRLARHDAARKTAMLQRVRLLRIYERAITSEENRVRREASRPEFRRALALASPAAYSAWERIHAKAPIPAKLLETLFRYLTRASGRATPNGLWAGVALANASGTMGGSSLKIASCEVLALAQPDLAVVYLAVQAMRQSERCHSSLGWRLNPSLHRTSRRGRRFLRRRGEKWHVVDAHDVEWILRLARVPDANVARVPEAWARAAGISEDDVREAIKEELLVPGVELEMNHADAWTCLDDFVAALPTREAKVWARAVSRLRRLAAQIERPHAISPQRFSAILNGARDTVNTLLMRYGATPLHASQAVLRVDARAPFAVSVTPALRKSIERAVEAFWMFDRFGLGELIARADAKAQTTALPTSLRAIAGFDWQLPHAAKRRRRRSASPSVPNSWEDVIEGIADARIRKSATRRLDRWAATLRRKRATDIVVLPQTDKPTVRPLTAGSALLMLRSRTGAPSIRIGSLSPDCGTFYGRFHALFERTAEPAFGDWLIGARAFAQHHGGVTFGDLAPSMAPNNAALRPRSGTTTIEPFHPVGVRFRVDWDKRGRLRLRDRSGGRVLPMATTAVDFSQADPISTWLANQMALLGRPSLLRPIPPLAMEMTDLKRSPELRLDRQALVQPRRWFLPATFFQSANGRFERYLSWRRYVRDTQLPELLYARAQADDAEFLVISTSCVSVESLYSAMKSADAFVQLQESFQSPETMLVRDGFGRHYVTEVAVAWRGDTRFWRELR